MEFTCLGTSSIGNCYLVKSGSSNILLDAGVPLNSVIKEINLNNLSCAFISHEHKDHSKEMKNLEKRGVQIVYGGINQSWNKNSIKRKFEGKFYTFGVEHGDTTCNGCVIETPNDTILYITDFNLCKWNLQMFEFTSIIVECNYCESKLSQELIDSDPKIKRQINTHMGLNGLMVFLERLNLTKCKEIILVHKSTDPRLYDEDIVKTKVYSKYFIPVGIAQIKGGIEWIGKEDIFNE